MKDDEKITRYKIQDTRYGLRVSLFTCLLFYLRLFICPEYVEGGETPNG